MTSQAMTLGRVAEGQARLHLERQGYQILGANLRCGPLEVDLLAADGETLILVEVRYRSPQAWTSGYSSLGFRKQQCLRKAGRRLWAQYKRDPRYLRLRFDLIVVSRMDGHWSCDHIRAAFSGFES